MKESLFVLLACVLLNHPLAQCAALNLSTNAGGASHNSYDLTGWQVVSTPGIVDGAGSGDLGPAVAMGQSLSLGSATALGAGWISAGRDFNTFLHSQPGATNSDGQRNNVGIYSFSRTFTVDSFAAFRYAVAGNDLLVVRVFSGNTPLSSFSFDSSSAMSQIQSMSLTPGVYTLLVDVANMPSGPLSNPLRFQSSPNGFLLSGSVQETPEPMTAGMVGLSLLGLGLCRRRSRLTQSLVATALTAVLAGFVGASRADAGALTLLPDSAYTPLGEPSAGIGYRVENDSDYWWRPYSVSVGQVSHASVSILFGFETLSPRSIIEVQYSSAITGSCPLPACGYLEVLWDLGEVQPGDERIVATVLSYDQFAEDPDSIPDAIPVSSIDIEASAVVGYGAPVQHDTPEPGGLIAVATGLGALYAVRRSTKKTARRGV